MAPSASAVSGSRRALDGILRHIAAESPLWTRAAALAISMWGVLAILRAAQLGRLAPYGSPFVEKFDWYFFHAVSFDIFWSLPWLVMLLVGSYALRSRRMARNALWWSVLGLHAAYLQLVVVDHELMRYMATHITVSWLGTYVNAASAAELSGLIAGDAGGAAIPVVLLIGAPAVFVAAAVLLARRDLLRPAVVWPLVVLPVAGLILTTAWGGGFRARKLRPALASLIFETRDARFARLDATAYAEAREAYQHLWLQAARRPWVFVDPEHAFFRMTPEAACTAGKGRACAQDEDRDGFDRMSDCDDFDAGVHPAQPEIPSNGVDENCDGRDAKPWNVILVLLETGRALNMGHLQPYGASEASSPFVDSLASQGRFWTRHSVNGLPTLEAFFAVHCSWFSRGHGSVVTMNTSNRFDCLPSILRRNGYQAHFFTAAAPDWDNQTLWLARWYDAYHFDRGRQTDLSLLSTLADDLEAHLDTSAPFFVTVMTKTNHVPFNKVADMTAAEQAAPNSIDVSMRYADRSLATFVDSVRDKPWFSRTVVVVTGDHGINLGELGYFKMGDPLHRASTWVPLVMVGAHPELGAAGAAIEMSSSHVDLAPTILDLAGLTVPNAFVGHSVVPGKHNAANYALAAHTSDIALELDGYRSLVSQVERVRDDGDQLYELDADFLERDPLTGAEHERRLARHRAISHQLQRLVWHALAADAIVPEVAEP